MTETEVAPERAFPAPVRVDGYAAWTWRLFRETFSRLGPVFAGGVILVQLLHLGIVLFLTEVLEAGDTVGALAVSLASAVLLSSVIGSLLCGIGSFVFLQHLAGSEVRSTDGWRRLRPLLGHVVVAALYVSMPLLTLLLFLGPIVQYVLLPAMLGPPVLVQAIVWEHRAFRDAATRAKNLLAGSWGRVVSTLLVLALGAALLQIVLLTLAGAALPDASDGDLAPSLWILLVTVLTTGPMWLFTAAASSVAYLDLRARFEDLDAAALRAEAEVLPIAG